MRRLGDRDQPREVLDVFCRLRDATDVFTLELRSRRPDLQAVEKVVGAGHRTVVYSHIEHHEVILTCLEIGAVAYVVKSEGRDQLLGAVYAAAADRPFLGPRMANAICNDRTVGRPRLTDREREILKAWFQTESKELVARRLFIEPSTVNTHLQRVRAKYAAAGRPATTKADLLARAVQDGIIGIEEV
ncbi:LuxR C-terminal-related transcriptional regulator [uncultured Mycolicibacterium sp.]|uniref:LuxR C-terminal-related transcriptional regulator n=1 Tax=uncultured Mycolicibacterium sp. TaxID=2320817 RepID=UPI002619A41B|nr:LuxR C-terminal-related transcriptional regulator [uncultured Mycolicibacterium sp.]